MLINYDPHAPAAAILSPGTKLSHMGTYYSGGAPPSVAGMIFSNIPFLWEASCQGEKLAASKEKGGKVPAILTHSSICSVHIQMQDTVPSNRAKSACPQILVLVVY